MWLGLPLDVMKLFKRVTTPAARWLGSCGGELTLGGKLSAGEEGGTGF